VENFDNSFDTYLETTTGGTGGTGGGIAPNTSSRNESKESIRVLSHPFKAILRDDLTHEDLAAFNTTIERCRGLVADKLLDLSTLLELHIQQTTT
jgi:hypothetical protein